MVRRENFISQFKMQIHDDIKMIMVQHKDDWEAITDHLLSLYDFSIRQGLSHDDWNYVVNLVNPEIFKRVYFESARMAA